MLSSGAAKRQTERASELINVGWVNPSHLSREARAWWVEPGGPSLAGHMSDLAGSSRGLVGFEPGGPLRGCRAEEVDARGRSRVGRAGEPSVGGLSRGTEARGPDARGPTPRGPIQGSGLEGVRAEGFRAEVTDPEGVEPRMLIQV